jgi:protein phosphatase
MDPDEVEDIPSNVIHRCLGPEPLVQVDIEGPHPIEAGDVYLVCSDGLSGQVTDQELGAVASVLPPAEACRFLVDLSNLRGGPDNITVIIVRIGSDAGSSAVPAPGGSALPRVPWWVFSLVGGTLLALGATALVRANWPDVGVALFVLAVVCFLAGLVGLGLHYRRERNRLGSEDENRPPPRTHRRRPCKIERPLLEKLVRALKALRQRADEKGWEPDWNAFQEHHTIGDELLAQGDLPAAFREYCRAMLPLTRALHDRRQKEEVFSPVWDKTR